MRINGPQKIVVLGMMGRMRVAGGVWQTLHYLIGLQRLGFDVYYIETHGCTLWAFGDSEIEAAAFINDVMTRFDMGARWAFHARTGSGQYYGMSQHEVARLYESAAAILNLHGGTVPTAQLKASDRLVYIDTDPVTVQLEIHNRLQTTLDFLEQHCALFTFAENYGGHDCKLPVSDFHFRATRQPVVLDFWTPEAVIGGERFTTIGNWQQLRRIVEFEGESYHWSKHWEFLKFIDLPRRTKQAFELALSRCDEDSRSLLEENGWKVRDAATFSHDLDDYQRYINVSRGEFTVAKDQNIRFRTGWFSDRSATYLAAGKPVVTQETGFSNVLPTGEGLFGFLTPDEVQTAIEAINHDYTRHSRAAMMIAREYFSHDVVLTSMLSVLGLNARSTIRSTAPMLKAEDR
jgi:hypothetical protein